MLRKAILLLSLLLAFSLVVSPSSALAAGLGVTPGKMEFSVHPGGRAVQTLLVINQSNEDSLFQVYVEGEKEEWFKVAPSEFTLSPQGTKGIEIVVAPPLTAFVATESHDFSICVVSLSPGSDLRLGAGIKVAAHVQLLELPIMAVQWWILTIALEVIVVIGLLFWRRRKAQHA